MNNTANKPQRTMLGKILIIVSLVALAGALLFETISLITYVINQIRYMGDSMIFWIGTRFLDSILAVLPYVLAVITAIKYEKTSKSLLSAITVVMVYFSIFYGYFGWLTTNIFCNTVILGWDISSAFGFWFGEGAGLVISIIELIVVIGLCLPTTIAAVIASFRKASGKFFVVANALAALSMLLCAFMYLIEEIVLYPSFLGIVICLSRLATIVIVFAVILLKNKCFEKPQITE